MKKVLGYLQRLRIYWIIVLPIDSMDLGEPVSRPRYYFLLVRHDVAVLDSADKIKSFVATMAHGAHEEVTEHVASRLFTKDSPNVQEYLKYVKQKVEASRGVGESGSSQTLAWPVEHEQFRVAKRLRPGSASVGLGTERMRSSFHLLRQLAGKNIIGDFSQSIKRVHPKTDGVSPTVTPNGVIYVEGRGVDRVVMPREKLLLHLFPLHKMNIPQDFPEEDLGKLGGNTMHLKSVGLALTIGLALSDFRRGGVSGCAQMGKAMPAIELPMNVVRRGL